METESNAGGSAKNGQRATPDSGVQNGIVDSVTTFSLGVVERSILTAAELARTACAKSQRLADAGIALHDRTAHAVSHTAHELSASAFGRALEGIDRVERAATAVLRRGHRGTEGADGLAAQASQAAVASRGRKENAAAHA